MIALTKKRKQNFTKVLFKKKIQNFLLQSDKNSGAVAIINVYKVKGTIKHSF